MPGTLTQSGAETALNAVVESGGTLFVALLTSDPATSAAGGNPAVLISDLVEVTTSGYARAAVNFTTASAALPSQATNTATVTWGPFTGDMLLPAAWAALVTSSSGTSGTLLFTWTLDTAEQASSSQEIQIATGELSISLS